MDYRITWKSVTLDLLIGFASSCLASGGMFAFGLDRDSRAFVAGATILFLLAGVARRGTGPGNLLFKALLIGVGAWIPAIVLDASGLGFTHAWTFALYLGVSVAFAALGIWIGRRAQVGSAKRWFLMAAASVAVAVILAAALLPNQIAVISRIELNRPAPSFNISGYDGRTIHSGELRGKVVVLAFWATWCGPCRREIPELVEFYARYRTDARVSFWMVNASWSKDPPAEAKAFLARPDLNLPCAFSSYRTDISLRVLTIPKVVVIDQTGSYRLIRTNYSKGDTLAKDLFEVVDRLLSRQVASPSISSNAR